jgi:hypothetical protein
MGWADVPYEDGTGPDRDSYLDVAEPIRVRTAAFARRAGTCDPVVWRGVRRLHGVRAGR